MRFDLINRQSIDERKNTVDFELETPMVTETTISSKINKMIKLDPIILRTSNP